MDFKCNNEKDIPLLSVLCQNAISSIFMTSLHNGVLNIFIRRECWEVKCGTKHNAMLKIYHILNKKILCKEDTGEKFLALLCIIYKDKQLHLVFSSHYTIHLDISDIFITLEDLPNDDDGSLIIIIKIVKLNYK